MASPNRVTGADYMQFWLKITDAAPWSPRSRAMAVSFRNKIWLLGGQTFAGAWPPGMVMLCVCVCMCGYMHIDVYIYMCVCVYIYIYIYI